MNVRPETVKCVLTGSEDDPRRTCCGRMRHFTEWVFTDPTHAYLNARTNGRLIVCPECAANIIATLHSHAWDGS